MGGAASTSRAGPSASPGPSRVQRAATFDENRRLLMQIEAQTRAGLDASQQRLHALEHSMASMQFTARQQQGRQQQGLNATPRPPRAA